jgi:hypothetical protein
MRVEITQDHSLDLAEETTVFLNTFPIYNEDHIQLTRNSIHDK